MNNWAHKVIRNLSRVKGIYRFNYGLCPICQSKTIFVAVDKWLRDNYCCVKCLSIPRQRAIVKIVSELFENKTDVVVHESSPSGPASSFFKKSFDHYSSSQYLTDVKCGKEYDDVRCENLESLTFENESFDLFITQDVMEHVFKPDKAFNEVARVLKPNGMYIFTVPYSHKRKQTDYRATITGKAINYIKEPQYHKNPVDENGSLVTIDYGRDLPELIHKWSGLFTTIYKTIDKYNGLDGEYIEVFVCIKNKE